LDEDNSFLYKQHSRVPGTFGRHDRRKGESLPAYHKRVSHELDSDDDLMMKMREKGFSDRQIADKLAKDGRVRYDQKSISTRIMRIRLAQAENNDFLLREGYKEWEYADVSFQSSDPCFDMLTRNLRMNSWSKPTLLPTLRSTTRLSVFAPGASAKSPSTCVA
jgi:hypothetical protein